MIQPKSCSPYGSLSLEKLSNDFTFENNLTAFSGKLLFSRIKCNPNERILSFYTSQEISKLISFIDTNSKIGKRNYAMLLLAAVLGFRASDIVNLKLEHHLETFSITL